MKRKLIIGMGFMMMSEMGFSQSRNDFKGPKAKNYKTWQHSVETTNLEIVSDQKEIPKGPAAKNNKRSLNLSDRTRKVAKVSNEMILNNERLGMVGPKAKNYKIGSN